MSVTNARPRYTIMHLAAPNDANGNPRRLFLVQDITEVEMPRAYDEGYYGSDAVPAEIRADARDLGRFEVTPRTYRDTLRRWRA